jgi:cyclic pyranopterin phosphate synthase
VLADLPHGDLAFPVRDRLDRPLRDLRISVTDRCNFRCTYCMPKSIFDRGYVFLPQEALLTFEEIERLAKIFVSLGVQKLRITGGEPLPRRNLEGLIEMLASLRSPEGKPLDLTLTTNGALLQKKAKALRAAGLNRITVSLDALDDKAFRAMNDVDFPVSRVLHGVEAAYQAGFDKIKINMVVKRGTNDQQIVPMARFFRLTPFMLRFIEYMDVGESNGWKMDEVVPSSEIIERISLLHPLEPVAGDDESGTARRWRYVDGSGEVGFISSVTQAFCGTCTRARISTEGLLFKCLFADAGFDLRALLRSSRSDDDIAQTVGRIWMGRDDRYSELRGEAAPSGKARRDKIEMSYIGG